MSWRLVTRSYDGKWRGRQNNRPCKQKHLLRFPCVILGEEFLGGLGGGVLKRLPRNVNVVVLPTRTQRSPKLIALIRVRLR